MDIAKKTLDEKTIAACRDVGWKLFEEGQISSGWMYLRASVETHEIVEKTWSHSYPASRTR